MQIAARLLVATALGVVVVLYVSGWLQLRKAGRDPGTRRLLALLAGAIAAVLATASPLAVDADARLSSHMVQHLVLLYVVAPLVVIARPVRVSPAGLPLESRRTFARIEGTSAARVARRALRSPLFIVTVVVAGMWLWHLPSAYEAALADGFVHEAEHATFVGAGLVLWSSVFRARRERKFGSAIFVAAATSLAGGALGAVLVFASHGLYPTHGGLDALADQQLAGALMWALPAVIHSAAVVGLSFAWMRYLDRRFGERDRPFIEPARYSA